MGNSGPRWRSLADRAETLLYRGGWPARLAGYLGYHPRVRAVRQHIRVVDGTIAAPVLRIGYASDFHAGPTTNPDLLSSACDALTAARPDLLLFGGDFVCMEAERIRDLAPWLGAIPARLGRYAVLGNHDWWTDPDLIVRSLEEAGITVLTNRSARLPAPYDSVFLCGLDDPWAGQPDAAAAFAGADGVRIVLMHAPSGLLNMNGERFALAVCGHTHGGQIALPGGVPIVVPHGPLSRRYSRGRFQLDNGGVLLVSVGVGCTNVPFRLFAHPEVLVCDLQFSAENPLLPE